ncbi:MAG TPA: hypothetical protein VGX68_17710 [Thermoanaerobaculia bacterium]|jgi:hypothetical protein|nr:hypothetical protein [Thermoanaerobaculia bacterium]
MFKATCQKRVLVTGVALLFAGALAVSAAEAEKARPLARVKKLADGTVSFKQIAGYTGYESSNEYHAKIKELTDPDAIAALKAKHNQLVVTDELAGGILGGMIESGTSVVVFEVTGGGSLEGFQHVITLPANFEVHSARHDPSAEIDTFATNLYRIESGVGSDEVFDSIRLVGGTANGYDSPGQMTLISKGDEVLVDSFFNVGFRLEVVGGAKGPLAGFQGTIEGSVTMKSSSANGAVADQSEAGRTKPAAAKDRQPAKEHQQNR